MDSAWGGGGGQGLGQARVPNSFCLQSLNIYTAASVAMPHLLSAQVLNEEGGKINPTKLSPQVLAEICPLIIFRATSLRRDSVTILCCQSNRPEQKVWNDIQRKSKCQPSQAGRISG